MDAIPYLVVLYLAFLFFMRPPRTVVLASLLGGLMLALINALADFLAYNAHWWHYTFPGLILHLPLPLYAVPFLVMGSIAYMLIWRYWNGHLRWVAILLLIVVPLLGFGKDSFEIVAQSGYLTWDSPLAGVLDFLLWPLMFYTGFFIFSRLAPPRQEEIPVSGA